MEFSKSLIAVCKENQLNKSFENVFQIAKLFHFMILILFL